MIPAFTRYLSPESEFDEFEPRLKSAKNRLQLSAAGLNLETLNTNLSGTNQFELRLKFKPRLKFLKFGLSSTLRTDS